MEQRLTHGRVSERNCDFLSGVVEYCSGEMVIDVADQWQHIASAVEKGGANTYGEVSSCNINYNKVELLALKHLLKLLTGVFHIFSYGGEQEDESSL